jgi:hypothetical protein
MMRTLRFNRKGGITLPLPAGQQPGDANLKAQNSSRKWCSVLWESSVETATCIKVCGELLQAWRDSGKKVFVLRSTSTAVREFYERMFPYLGTPRALAEDVRLGGRGEQRSGQIWMEVRYDPEYPDAYRHSANAQPLHTDGSYIPNFPNASLLACVANAQTGGETTFIDVDDVVAALEIEEPALLTRISTIVVPHERSGDRRLARILEDQNGCRKLHWNYYCVAADAAGQARALADEFHRYLLHSDEIRARTIAVKLLPGDMVLWKDDELLHGRNAFSATAASERFIWKCAFDVGVFGQV